jgi:Spy/CpxP family protein refolding chaperone
MTASELLNELNYMHTRAYELAVKHYQEAMDIVLTPKQKKAVVEKANEIRELWDGIHEVTIESTERKMKDDK